MLERCEAAPPPLRKPSDLARPESYQWEPYGAVYKQMAPFIETHWRENEPLPEASPYDPDFDLLFNLEHIGKFAVYTCRQGELIQGFHAFTIATTFSRCSVVTAVSDLLYVRPAARGGSIAYRLVVGPEKGLLERGAKFCRYTPSSTYNIKPLLLRAGYATKGGDFEKVLK